MKILTILGARPQFIKAGTVSREIAKHEEIEEVIVHIGQHYNANMSDMFYRKLAKKPSCNVKKNYILATIHRAENTDNEERLRAIFEALKEISKEKQIILPLHPRTKAIVSKLKIDISTLTIIDPVGYLEMVWLIDNCDLVMTDSGGLQKEEFFFEKRCITLRDETEWVELIENGYNVLVCANREKIVELYSHHAFNDNYNLNFYGGGKASEKIVEELLHD